MATSLNSAPSKGLIALASFGIFRQTVSLYFGIVQRLFSMFPAGAAGCGLLLLRVCAAGMLVHNSIADGTVPIAMWKIGAVILFAGALCLGVFTPVGCCISAVWQAFMMLGTEKPDALQFAFSFCVSAALLFLGPGAFSVDSRLFGRRLIVHRSLK